jgi:signal transduction histidine kinase/CheY-like chemotaxis protein
MAHMHEILEAIERPAVLIAADGAVDGNSAFQALPAPVRARALSASPPPGWMSRTLSDGARLVSGAGAETTEARGLLAQERTLATLSHEIRTPLNGVLGMAGLLARTPLDPTQAAYLATLTESGEHLLELVNEVLDFAKLDAGRLELEPAPTDIERLLQGVAELLSPRAHAGGVDIAWAASGPPPTVMVDDGRLRQILFNLAGNAVKMTEAGGVLITAEGRKARAGRITLRFAVRDTGPGLEPAAQARIFEEFEQTAAGVRAGGAGLGLAIVQKLADAFEGKVGVDSQLGEGACFWFEAAFEVAPSEPAAQPLKGLTVAIASASAIVREAAALQVRASGGRPLIYETLAEADRQAPRAAVLLVDPAEPSATPEAAPPSRLCLVLLTPEARSFVHAYRNAGYVGYLIKPLRRASLAARVLAALDPDAAVAPAAQVAVVEDERAQAKTALGIRILLAEDNPVNAMLATALLAREGCQVTRVGSGEEAVDAMAAAPYDLVLMDVRMPGMDGLEATRRLRAEGVRTPILALTADAYEDDRRACMEAGMDDFLTKPMNLAAVRAALARWTRAAVEAKLAS